ncbi:unnamed protein product [Cylicocyclus nassatus]|uniref:Endonuclease/exonuclease/phosphatase domain-containing protein n=1 Tax=Cylicocyclus nassatus TaxID=53992 RepID=A0AA36GYK0_CYLNA|nr:unnamed protein product [Cylicocyclus nassatus]
MLSKLLGFLSEIFTKSRARQWERVLGKQLEITEAIERTSGASRKRTAKVFPYTAWTARRTLLPMLVPQNSILVWKDPPDPKNAASIPSLSLLFDFPHDGSPLLVALRRPISEPFSETIKRIETKIQKVINPQKGKKSKPSHDPVDSAKPVAVEAPGLEAVDSLSLEDAMTSLRNLVIDGQSFTVIREPPDIASLACLLKPIAGCPIYPAVDFRQGTKHAEPMIHWYIRNLQHDENVNGRSRETAPKEIITLLDGPSRRFSASNCEYRWTGANYVPSAIDVGKNLFLVADLGPEAIVKSAVSKHAIETIDEPLLCEGIVEWCRKEKPPYCLRILSYNLLADLYLDLSGPQESLFFPYCPKAYQMYEYRYPLLLKELLSYDMDLCFLQEVDHRMQMRYLSALFGSINVEMCFAKKEKEVTEGSVIAFRRERFDLISTDCYGIASLLESSGGDINNIINSSAESLQIFISRPTTIQVVILRDRIAGDVLICGNTHLHHNPKHEHLKVLQAVIAVRKLESVRRQFAESNPNQPVRLLFAGDFNSDPSGPVYELLSTGTLPKESRCWKLDENIVPEDIVITQNTQSLSLKNLTGTEASTIRTVFISFTGETNISHCYQSRSQHPIAQKLTVVEGYACLPTRGSQSTHGSLWADVRLDSSQLAHSQQILPWAAH